MWGEHWIAGTGLCLIFFHCLVDFPLRQPQPVFLAVIYLALLSLPGPCHEWRIRFPPVLPAILGVLLILSSLAGLRDQQLLKRGFEQFLGSRMAGDADSEQKSLQPRSGLYLRSNIPSRRHMTAGFIWHAPG
ncbi:MAG: hypothetical protein UZ16_OP3001002229 [Candidatus Hinthialibacteria bacterium OLB16]|nr:MAG: hypothetical protein UZ16_OP3001002229 [Candidatus Hinthialibacteria bacterium OLB16]